jgi:hypothetical protein
MRPVVTLVSRSLWQTIGAQFGRCLLLCIGVRADAPSGHCLNESAPVNGGARGSKTNSVNKYSRRHDK